MRSSVRPQASEILDSDHCWGCLSVKVSADLMIAPRRTSLAARRGCEAARLLRLPCPSPCGT